MEQHFRATEPADVDSDDYLIREQSGILLRQNFLQENQVLHRSPRQLDIANDLLHYVLSEGNLAR